MAQSFCKLVYHIVFATRGREAALPPEVRTRVHAYLATLIRNEGGVPHAIDGSGDHIHILAQLRQDISISDFVRSAKAHSSKWIRRSIPNWTGFRWQAGYGAFTVGRSEMTQIRECVENQEEHHRSKTFREEFVEILRRQGLKFDERDLLG
jgi:REP element-mobilizing transposase RayT